MKYTWIFLFLTFCFCTTQHGEDPVNQKVIWYRQPAHRWLESLPVGNGRLGALVFGGQETERIALNVSTMWSGAPSTKNVKPSGAQYLPKIRHQLFAGDYAAAKILIKEHMLGNKDSYGTHLPMGDLFIRMQHSTDSATNYTRSLDISKAMSLVEYELDGVQYTREMFASNPDDLLVLRLSVDKPAALSFTVRIGGEDLPHRCTAIEPGTLVVEGQAREEKHSDGNTGVNFSGAVQIWKTDGIVETGDGELMVSESTHAVLLFAANTTYSEHNPLSASLRQLEAVADKEYGDLYRDHIRDYQQLFNRVQIDFGEDTYAHMPTDERLLALSENPDDPALYALFYQFGRYLLIASSRENSPLPANLQGLWNDDFACKIGWTCDFHMDINTQQNYWPAESGNLAECHEPLFRLIEKLSESGVRTARDLYNADGWVAHVFTNAWGFSAPGWGLGWGLHTTGGIWLASHVWDHFEYTGDTVFLRERAYPVLKGAVRFFEGYLIEHPEYGWLVSGPSVSPENWFIAEDGKRYGESMGPTCDVVLIRDLFDHCIEASKLLQTDTALRENWIDARDKLPPLQIGRYGQLQEWLEDYEEAIPNHRHMSHLIALYPSDQINPVETPALAEAARTTIERRTGRPDWEDVEWSRANLINFYARLRDREMAYKHLHGLITENSDLNMMTYSRSGIAGARNNIWVMDGNTAGTNGISEMLLQSYNDTLYVLPALPSPWQEGSVKGLCARGAFEIAIRWAQGELSAVEVKSKRGNQCNVSYGEQKKSFKTKQGQSYLLNGQLDFE